MSDPTTISSESDSIKVVWMRNTLRVIVKAPRFEGTEDEVRGKKVEVLCGLQVPLMEVLGKWAETVVLVDEAREYLPSDVKSTDVSRFSGNPPMSFAVLPRELTSMGWDKRKDWRAEVDAAVTYLWTNLRDKLQMALGITAE